MSSSKDKKEEKHVKLEDVAEETGELLGKGIRKTWSVMKSFGKGVVDTIEKDARKDVATLTCPRCGASIPSYSNFPLCLTRPILVE